MKQSLLKTQPTDSGETIFWFGNKQVEYCSIIKLLELDQNDNWKFYAEVGRTLVMYPGIISGYRKDVFNGEKFIGLIRTSGGLIIPSKKKKFKVGDYGVINYLRLHDELIDEAIKKSNFDSMTAYADKRYLINTIISNLEKKHILNELEQRTFTKERQTVRKR